jgi:hypothetical protein
LAAGTLRQALPSDKVPRIRREAERLRPLTSRG